MKNMYKEFGIIVLIIAVLFTITVCEGGAGGCKGGKGGKGGNPAGRAFSVSGTFTKPQGGGSYRFELQSDEAQARNIRAVSADDYSLDGKLQDESMIFLLKGTYDPESGMYSASSSSSMLRLAINGKVNSSGTTTEIEAAVTVNDGNDNWVTYPPVTLGGITIDSEPGINGAVTEPEVPLIPDFAMGLWKFSQDVPGMTHRGTALVSPCYYFLDYSIIDGGIPTFKQTKVTVVEISNSGSTYELIVSYNNGTNAPGMKYQKFKAVFSNGNSRMTVIMAYQSTSESDYPNDFDTLAEAKAATTWDEDALPFSR